MIVSLVRHATHGDVGQVLTGRLPGRPLTSEGEAQAACVAARLAAVRVTRVLSSPRERAQATAAAIAARHGLPVETEAALDEIDFGTWAGRRFEELDADPAWQAWNGARGLAATPAGDTMLAVQHRARALIRGLEGRVVLVSHADVIRAIVADHLGLAIDNWARIEISPASITTLEIGTACATLLGLNEGVSAAWN